MREDWIECKSCDLLDVRDGTHDTPRYINDGGFPLITSKNLIKGNIDFSNTKFISEIDMNLINQRSKVDIGDILFAMIGTIGNPVVVKEEPRFSIKNIGLFKNKINIVESLLFKYFLDSPLFLNQLDKRQLLKGTTQKFIPLGSLRDIDFPLAPLPEQRAIVKKLESLFSSLDAGVADLKKAQQQLKIYSQAVLKKAFEGEFVEVKFKELGNAIDPQPSHRTPPVDANGIPYVSIKDIVGNKLELSKARLVSKNVLQEHLNRYTILENDFIIGKIGTIGNPVKVHLPQNYTLSANVVLIQPRKINSNYLYYYFKSSNIEQQFNSGKKATTQAAFGIQKVRDLVIRYPLDDSQQRKIVLDIETKLSVCDSIEQNIKESLEKAEALRQSILKKAFEGNLLTAKELAECKQAADYEPASVLLERIKAEQNKAAAKPSKKKVAEPLVVAKVETPVAKISADIHAGLIAKVIKIHEENSTSIDNLSHIKCEKIAHLVEYHLQIPLGRQPVKDAAGPDDYPHLKSVESRAKKAGFFNIVKKPIGYSYSSASNSGKVIDKFQSALSDEKNRQLDNLIALFLKFDLEVSEIIATTYAGWNNLILNGNANPSDEEIVYESRENWSERKLKIAIERFFKAIEWMRKNEIVPIGYGAVVPFPKKKK
ncbi:restriction endonuclease subunit S [Pedobacter agri]|uniref:Restriction endonuclease subunit S n=1 Tax=Pedobacter agri TaxID=454586 RepID=A0A9X3D8Y5_9SPHI|nr:restriction endonuclease subunit S [Pedobacter agri]MCX3263117.1 restriction endonuclease subunit S [Pedobacter agri]